MGGGRGGRVLFDLFVFTLKVRLGKVDVGTDYSHARVIGLGKTTRHKLSINRQTDIVPLCFIDGIIFIFSKRFFLSRCVEPHLADVAGMFGCAAMGTGKYRSSKVVLGRITGHFQYPAGF